MIFHVLTYMEQNIKVHLTENQKEDSLSIVPLSFNPTKSVMERNVSAHGHEENSA